MSFQSRMQLHVLVYQIVSFRILCGNYEDSVGVRSRLEAETRRRIRRLSELENKSEIEAARSLCDMYQTKVDQLPASHNAVTRAPRPTTLLNL